MRAAVLRTGIRASLVAGVLLALLIPGVAFADVCLRVDEARDTFTASERAAALLLLQRQFELEGQHVVPPGCQDEYTVSHVRLGNTITITLSGAKGQRDAVARGMDDVPAVYSQMVRSLLRGQPMTAPGVVDRGNVTNQQARAANRVSSDSLLYARLGYGAVFGNRTYGGPSVGMLGYRREFDSFAIDVSFFSFQFKSSDRSYDYFGPTGTSGQTGNWLKIAFLRFGSPQTDRSFYYGGGLSLSAVNLNSGNSSWSGGGLQGELTTGYEIGRTSSVRVFVQADAGLPFFKLDGHSYLNVPPYTVTTSRRYAPAVTLSLGVGWQRGGNK